MFDKVLKLTHTCLVMGENQIKPVSSPISFKSQVHLKQKHSSSVRDVLMYVIFGSWIRWDGSESFGSITDGMRGETYVLTKVNVSDVISRFIFIYVPCCTGSAHSYSLE